MDEEKKREAATAQVLQFAKDWTDWETRMARSRKPFENKTLMTLHQTLITQHCTPKKRTYVDGLPTFGTPPTYDGVSSAQVFHTELAAPGKVFVDVRSTRMLYRFVVKSTRAGWRIDSIKWKITEASEWINGLIGM